MAAFEYVAVDNKGKNKKGVIEGDTARHVRSLLREQGLIPLEVTTTLQKTKQKSSGFSFGQKKKVTASELALLTRQLATLVESGLPIEEALLAVAEQCEKNSLKSMVMIHLTTFCTP